MTVLTDLLWAKAKDVLFLDKVAFLKLLDGWEIKPVYSDGELGWITVQKGPEFHFETVGATRILPMRIIREFLQSIIDQHGYAQTKTPVDDFRQQRFNERFGFQRIGQDAFDIIYRIERLPHA